MSGHGSTLLPYDRKNPLPFPLFRSGHMSAICARLSKGKVGVQRGRKTAGCPSFLPPRRAPRRPAVRRRRISTAESQRKTLRPLGRTRLRQFVCPGQPVQKKEPSVRGEPACGSSRAPVSRCRKRSRPSGSNPPAAVRVPRSVGAGKGAARWGEPAYAVRALRRVGAKKFQQRLLTNLYSCIIIIIQ